jgi:hypothetical protein
MISAGVTGEFMKVSWPVSSLETTWAVTEIPGEEVP